MEDVMDLKIQKAINSRNVDQAKTLQACVCETILSSHFKYFY